MGIGVGMDPDDVQRLGWVDEALAKIEGKTQDHCIYSPLPGRKFTGRETRSDRNSAE